MFGLFRAFLAVMVVTQHLGGFKSLGSYAVFGFYILSGYLMTSIMHETYSYTVGGFKRYVANRFLRIYPVYVVSLLATLLLFSVWGAAALTAYHGCIYWPLDVDDAARIVFLYFPNMECPRFTPPAWALTVEIFFYIAIGFGASRYKWLTQIWFLVSVLYHLFAVVKNLEWQYKYFSIMAASLPFSTGALIFHYKNKLISWFLFCKGRVGLSIELMFYCVFILNWALGHYWGLSQGAFFYTSYIICAFFVIYLTGRPKVEARLKSDKWLGGLSYPIYLFHYQVGFIVMVTMDSLSLSLGRQSILLVLCTLIPLTFLAMVINKFIERPIEKFRVVFRRN